MPSLRSFNLIVISFKCCLGLAAQELQFDVSINAEVVQTTERGIFTEMETVFERFLNDTEWTADRFQNNEKN